MQVTAEKSNQHKEEISPLLQHYYFSSTIVGGVPAPGATKG